MENKKDLNKRREMKEKQVYCLQFQHISSNIYLGFPKDANFIKIS